MLCYSHFKYSLPTHLVSSLFSDFNSDQLSRTTQGSTIGHAQGIYFGRLRRGDLTRQLLSCKCAKEIEILSEIFKSMKKKKTRVFSGSEVIQLRDPVDYYFVLKLCLHKIMPGPNGFNVSLFQGNNGVKNLMCMASQSIENIWWFENIVFHVLFFNQLCPSKKAKTFDWHTSVLSQLECSVCHLFGQNSDPSPLLSPITLISSFSSPWMAKRSTLPRHCLTENMAWGTYITDDAAQKIQAWISYKTEFQNRVQNSARVNRA